MIRFLLLLFFTLLISCKGTVNEHSIILNADEYNTEVLGKNVQLVDVRTQEEFDQGHIEDAINIDFFEDETFDEKFAQFDKNAPIYIYCQSGGRSQKSAKILQQLGFKNIIDLEGGYGAWVKEN